MDLTAEELSAAAPEAAYHAVYRDVVKRMGIRNLEQLVFSNLKTLLAEDPDAFVKEVFSSAWEGDLEVLRDQVARRAARNKAGRPGAIGWFVTVPFPDEVDLPSVVALTAAIGHKYKFLAKGYEYVFEQKGETSETAGKHPHLHILFERGSDASKKDIYTQLGRHFKEHIGCTVNVVPLTTEADIAQRRGYIRGDKKAAKLPAVAIDPVWRAANQICDLYSVSAQ